MILEIFSEGPQEFRPTDIKQYTILQIAREFNALNFSKDYLMAAERYSLTKLLKAYRKARPAADRHSAFFHALDH